jgi:hypothetical protein
VDIKIQNKHLENIVERDGTSKQHRNTSSWRQEVEPEGTRGVKMGRAAYADCLQQGNHKELVPSALNI